MIFSQGLIFFGMPASLTVTCEFDYTNFPFDEQSCPIVLGDWVHASDEILMTNRMNNSAVDTYLAGYGMGKKVHMSVQ